jgi:hypothetical protein
MSENAANKALADKLRGLDQKTLDQARQSGREAAAHVTSMQSVKAVGAPTPTQTQQQSEFTFNREHGKHNGNVITPAVTQGQQNSTVAQQPAVENKTPAQAQAASKQQVFDQGKAYVEKATSQPPAASREAKAPDKGQQQEQAISARKAPAKGRGR